ncbi:MAG: chromosome segregation protein SMC [Lachnospiraceae bacterium]|nr:chromosome segregation protein SMC [Lachnospiraceae bacterium]
MYLKNIEIHGFKSFANKINFKFHNGITGIVGPNGSGKSNVADAVRWVLGEQRIKQLRGASMQDVIFSGTELRKPLGYAYVAITLDNSDHQLAIDYEEVTVARRLYRSGESEYLINGTPCRLKDVNELFYDTGIGKEGYSIIGQGQIDKILSGKPEERRELFDEAAGIVKFKRRKYAAVKKLEDEQQNLIRVKDILGELEKQIGPLEKQAEKAKIYLKKKEELKTLDVNVFLLENQRLREQLSEVEGKLKIAGDDLATTTSQYENIKVEYENVEAQIERLEQAIEEGRANISNTSEIKGKLEGEINVLKEQINSAKGTEGHLKNRLDTVQKDVDSKEAEKQIILDEKKVIDEQLSRIEQVRDEAKNRLQEIQNQIENLNFKIEVAKNQIIDTLNERATIKSKMGRYDTMMEQINIRKAELNSRILRAKSSEDEQNAIIKEYEEAFEAVTNEISELNDTQKKAQQKERDLKAKIDENEAKVSKLQEKYHQEKSKLDAISNITERYDGYGNSIRKVMEQKESHKGIIGVVADIIKVDAKYETAIETALGGNIQNVVTDDEETAKKMIQYLKENRFGRATFLPLTSITNPQEFKNPESLSEKGVIGMADELVDTAPEYRNVAKAMLGRIVVVDNVDHAVKIAKKYDYGIRMVTVEGELLVPGGAISGGAFKNNSNLLGRRREMDELSKQIKKIQDELATLKEEIEKEREERLNIRKENDERGNLIQKKFIEQNTARLNLSQAKEKKEETKRDFGDLKTEQIDIENQITEITRNKEDIIQKLADSEQFEIQVNEQIKEDQKSLEGLRSLETEQTAKVSELDVEVEKILQKEEFERQNVNRIEGELMRFTGELNEIKEGLLSTEEDVARKLHNIEEIEKTILASVSSKSDAEEKLKADIEKKDELSANQKKFFATREELAERMNNLDKEVYRLTAQKEKMEGSIEGFINYMWDEYEITLSDAASLRNEALTDLSAMKKDISSLKDQIRKLGDVNVNAIEDYKNVMERYEFLKTQHDDLVEAEQTLQKIIEELDASMRKQFKEKFSDICREFDKVFKELFGGGKGTLELMEEEDILEAGIRIIAQPPGKKLQNMMQLSGGEKALTAIALLFAIQNLKPSPFCLLDEIEAALDESNVGRFAKYLHKLTKHTQFIVITHRRGTMESADRLYGITMQEKGVSALVSVSLIDSQLDD